MNIIKKRLVTGGEAFVYHITNKKTIELIEEYLNIAAEEAKKSTCEKGRYGAVLVKGKIIGKGYNEPVLEELCCLRDYIHDNSEVERCTAIHAEANAIKNACKNKNLVTGATLYITRRKFDETKEEWIRKPVGEPSCTLCGKEILKHKIGTVIVHQKTGYYLYFAKDFVLLSYDYLERRKRLASKNKD